MTTRAARISLCASTIVGLVVAGAILRARRHEHYRIVDKRREVEGLLFQHQLDPRGLMAVVPGLDDSARLKREPIDRQTAEKLFSPEETLVYDAKTIYRYASNLHQTLPLAEHPDGQYLRRTNSAGEREDHETFVEKPDLFVLVTGDSHTDGVCNNGETFPNLLEAELARAHAGEKVEVLNTGVAGYGPYHYLSVLEKYLPREPRVHVLTFFGGNDFNDVLPLRHFFDHTLRPKSSRDAWAGLEREKHVSRAAILQGVNQILHFRHFPEEAILALETCNQVNAEIDRLCRARDIPWIFVYIPSVFDGPWIEQAEMREHCKQALDLTDWDVAVGNRLADAMLGALRRRGVDVLDLRPVFAAEAGPWYWPELHVDLRSQSRLAELLAPRVEAALSTRAAHRDAAPGTR